MAKSWDPASPAYVGRFRMVPTGANHQPAAAAYVRAGTDESYRALAIAVLTAVDGRITEITGFHNIALFAAFGLPLAL